MSTESASQSSASSSAESSSNSTASITKEAKRIRPKTAKVKVTKFRKTGFEEDEEIDDSPPAKKPAPIFPTFFHQDLLTNIPLFNNGSNLIIENVDEKTSIHEFATIDTATSSVLAIDGKKKRKVHFADDIGKKLVEVKYYEIEESNSTATADANVRNQHLNEAEPLKNAFDRFDGSDESSSNSFASVNEHKIEQEEENVASPSQAYAKDYASFLDSLSRSTMTSNDSFRKTLGRIESVFASNPNPVFLTDYNVVDTVTSSQSDGDLKYDRNDNKELLDPRYSKQISSNKKHFYHRSYASERYERNDYQRERSRSHHRRRSPDEQRGRSRRGRSPDKYQTRSRDYGSRGSSPDRSGGRNRHSQLPNKYHSRNRDYGSYNSYLQHPSRSPPSHSSSKKKSHHSNTRKFSRSPSRDRF